MATPKRPTYVATVSGLLSDSIGDLYELAELCGGVVESVNVEHGDTTNGATARTRSSPTEQYPNKVLLLAGRSSPKGKRALLIHQHLVQAVQKRNGEAIPRDKLNAYLAEHDIPAKSYSPAISIMIREGSIRAVEPKKKPFKPEAVKQLGKDKRGV